jgi:hypothetical protein
MGEIGKAVGALEKRVKAAEERADKLEAENLELLRKLLYLSDLLDKGLADRNKGLEELKALTQSYHREVRRMVNGQADEREFLPPPPWVPRFS